MMPRYEQKYLTINGEKKTLRQWAQVSPVGYETIRKRLRLGWGEQEAVFLERMTDDDEDFKAQHRWRTLDGVKYYLVPADKYGNKVVERIHNILKREDRQRHE